MTSYVFFTRKFFENPIITILEWEMRQGRTSEKNGSEEKDPQAWGRGKVFSAVRFGCEDNGEN